MAKKPSRAEILGPVYETDPDDVFGDMSENDGFKNLAMFNLDPKELPDLKYRARYEAYLKKKGKSKK